MSDTGERGGIRQRIVDDYAGRKLYDERGEKLGKVEYTVLDADGRPEYLAVKTGWFGSNTTLIPESILRPGERDDEFEVQASEDRIKDAPTFGDEDDVTPDFEDRVRSHFGMGSGGESSGSGSSGGAAGAGAAGAAAASTSSGSRDRDTRDDPRERSSSGEGGSRDDDRAFDEGRDRDSRDRESRGEERGERSSESRSDSGERSTEDRGAGGMARDADRGDRHDDDRRDDRSSSGSGGGREKVRVTVKRERARAERIRGEDGQEEVRIRKEMIEEEEMVEVEDRLS